jgi:hypothetical protein
VAASTAGATSRYSKQLSLPAGAVRHVRMPLKDRRNCADWKVTARVVRPGKGATVLRRATVCSASKPTTVDRHSATPRPVPAATGLVSRVTPGNAAAPLVGAPTAPASSSAYADRAGLALNHKILLQSESVIEAVMTRLRTSGVNWVRADLPWAATEPHRGVFNWSQLDRLMTAAAATNMNVLGILDYSAPWASSDPSGRGDVMYPPTDPGDFAAYARAVIDRYGANGAFHSGQAPDTSPLRAVEIWNEPYGDWFWKPGPDPAKFVALVEATAPVIHAEDPSMTVLAAGDIAQCRNKVWQGTWLASLLAIDPNLPKLIDAWAVHPYPAPWTLGPDDVPRDPKLGFQRVALTRQTSMQMNAALPIWITEVGWSTAAPSAGGVTEDQQAQFTKRAVQMATDDWGQFVPRTFFYDFDKSTGVPTDHDGNYGLLRADGSEKPAWTVLRSMLTS